MSAGNNAFYFLMTYGVCKKRKYCNRMSEKKNSLLLMNFHVLYVLEDKTIISLFTYSICDEKVTSNKKFRLSARPSVCLAVCLSGCLSVCLYVDFYCRHNNFRRSYRIETKFGGCLLCIKCGSGIKIQSKSWSWSRSWREFWFSQKLCGATPNLVDIFSI